MKHLRENKTTYIVALISALMLALFFIGYNAGNDDRRATNSAPIVTTTTTTTSQAEQVEQCKRYIVDNKDFPGYKSKECKGIQEDDYRLNVAYRTINPNGTGTLCEQMYALAQADEEHSYELTHLLQSYGMTEDVLVANFDVCEALGYTWAE